MKHFYTLIAALLVMLMTNINLSAQDPGAIEDIIVECYYLADADDAADTDGGSLADGSVTYRIYVDLKEGFELNGILGNATNIWDFTTTTEFFNNEDRGEETGDAIDNSRLDENTVALDSWVTLGASSDEDFGVLKTVDPDGSELFPNDNDLLANEPGGDFLPHLTDADGMVESDSISATVYSPGLDLSMFADENDGPYFFVGGPDYIDGNGNPSTGDLLFVPTGVTGLDSTNIVLIAQMTTDGVFSFNLNLQVGEIGSSTPINYMADYDPAEDDQPGFETYGFDGLSQSGIECIVTGIAEYQSLNDQFSITPNPAEDIVMVDFSRINTGGPSQLQIMDKQGRTVAIEQLNDVGSSAQVGLDVASLAQGVYFLRLQVGEAIGIKRFVKL